MRVFLGGRGEGAGRKGRGTVRGIKGRLYQGKKYRVHTQRDLKISLSSAV